MNMPRQNPSGAHNTMTTKALADSGHDCRLFSMSGVTQVYSAPRPAMAPASAPSIRFGRECQRALTSAPTPVDSRIAISVTVSSAAALITKISTRYVGA